MAVFLSRATLRNGRACRRRSSDRASNRYLMPKGRSSLPSSARHGNLAKLRILQPENVRRKSIASTADPNSASIRSPLV